MINIDIVCPLFNAGKYIDGLIENIKKQEGVLVDNVVFALTDGGDASVVKEKIKAAGFFYFSVTPEKFSHSLTRQKAIFDYCKNDIVVMISQDVNLLKRKR